MSIGKILNEMQALIALNTTATNVLLVELAYSQGNVDYKVVVKMKELFTKTVESILKNTDPSVRAEVGEIADQIARAENCQKPER